MNVTRKYSNGQAFDEICDRECIFCNTRNSLQASQYLLLRLIMLFLCQQKCSNNLLKLEMSNFQTSVKHFHFHAMNIEYAKIRYFLHF